MTQRHDRPSRVLWRAGCSGMGTSGSAGGSGKRTGGNAGTAPRLDPDPSRPSRRSTSLVFSECSSNPNPASTSRADSWAALASASLRHATTKSSA